MLVLYPSSACDICMDAYASDDPDKTPYAIPCGHIFCRSCIAAFTPPNCPICRKPFVSNHAVKLHVDRVAASDEIESSQQPAPSWELPNDEQWDLTEIQDQQLQIVFERETSQAIEAQLSEQCKALEKNAADYKAQLERLRTTLEWRMTREAQDYQLQIIFERETAQAMEVEFLEKSKVLEDKVAGLETEIQRLHREGFLQKVLEQKVARDVEDYQRQIVYERETAQAVKAALLKKSKGLEDQVAEYEGVIEQLRIGLEYKENHCHSCNLQRSSDGRGTNSLSATPVETPDSDMTAPSFQSTIQQHRPGGLQLQSTGRNPFRQNMSPHTGGQGSLPPYLQTPMGSTPSNIMTPPVYLGSPAVATPSTFTSPTHVPGPQPRPFMDWATSVSDQNVAYGFRVQHHQQQQHLSSLPSQPTGAANGSAFNPNASSPGPRNTWGAWPSSTSLDQSSADGADEQGPGLDAKTAIFPPSVMASPPVGSPLKKIGSLNALKPLSHFFRPSLHYIPAVPGRNVSEEHSSTSSQL